MMLSIVRQDTVELRLRIVETVLDSIVQKSLTQLMALRVLLADESATIKKVFQLALQDFAVEVQSVNVGVDVLPVARKFKPDIVFADILLQKRNGYDVCADFKGNADLGQTPVVLLWSSFLEMDEDKYQVSKANAHLEKPFDVKTLRGLVQELVPKTKSQTLSSYLHFPKMPEIIETPPKEGPTPQQKTPTQPPKVNTSAPQPQRSFDPTELAKEKTGDWNMETFEPIKGYLNDETGDFSAVTLPAVEPTGVSPLPSQDDIIEDDAADGQWVSKDLSRFQTDLDPNADDSELPVQYSTPQDPEDSHSLTAPPTEGPPAGMDREPERIEIEEPRGFKREHDRVTSQPGSSLTREEIEEIVRTEARKVIENAVWQVVPDLAERLIEKELHRLLDEREV